jgi:purine-binding chemotaxis protein CheW
MSNKAFANEDVMEDYMSALLTEEPMVEEIQRQTVEQLLEASPNIDTQELPPQLDDSVSLQPLQAKVIVPEVEKSHVAAINKQSIATVSIPEDKFQVLLFEIAGMTLAVPLIELGGIHKIDTINPLFGKPDWFKGVLLHREEKFNVVDTAKWVMPGQESDKSVSATNYQYLIALGKSGWGLACEHLVATETLLPEDVKWRNLTGSRPWLSGMVKKKMCALVNVQQLISMLEQGLSSKE